MNTTQELTLTAFECSTLIRARFHQRHYNRRITLLMTVDKSEHIRIRKDGR